MSARAMDPEIRAGYAAQPQPAPGPSPTTIPQIRAVLDAAMLAQPRRETAPVTVSDAVVPGADSPAASAVPVRIYRPTDEPVGAVVVFVHGGGTIAGSLDTHDQLATELAADGAAVVLSVGYRLAPEHPYPAAHDDVTAVLAWVDAHRVELGAVDLPLVLAGDSAGGGIATSVAIAAQADGGPAIAQLLLIAPMLDDRTQVTNRRLVPLMTWPPQLNQLAWSSLLGAAAGTPAAPAGAVPARADDLAGLPPVYLEVGDLDLFLGEVLTFATRLGEAGVPLELHVHRGLPHLGDAVAVDSAVAGRIRADRARVLRTRG